MAVTGPGTYTASELSSAGWGAANDAPTGSTITLGGVPYVVYSTQDGRRTLSVAPSQSQASGSASVNNDTSLRSVSLGAEDKAALTKLYEELKLMAPEKFLPEAQAELTPYYERLLKEANYDVEVAKKRLEEDYARGLRQKAEDTAASLKQLLGYDFPAEQKKSLEDLNQRGMLGTILNTLAKPKTETLTQTTDTGTATASTVAGEPINATYNPNLKTSTVGTFTQPLATTATFGGVAGKTMSDVGEQQDARKEAITRAFTRYNEEQSADRKSKLTDYTTQGARKQRDLTQERNEKIGALSAEKMNRAIALNTAKRQAIVEPAQMKLQGLSY